MNDQIYENKVSNVFAGARMYKFGFMFMLASQLMLCVVVIHLFKSQKISIKLPHDGEEMIVSSYSANDAYIRRVTGDTMRLYLCYTSASIREQYNELLNDYAPDAYSEEYLRLSSLIKAIEDKKAISSTFALQNITLNTKKNTIEVFGHRILYDDNNNNGNNKLLDKMQTHIIFFRIQNGEFKIVRIVDKDDLGRDLPKSGA